jgi:hypothetical protein
MPTRDEREAKGKGSNFLIMEGIMVIDTRYGKGHSRMSK